MAQPSPPPPERSNSPAPAPPDGLRLDVLIPAYNEEASLPLVLVELPKAWVRRVIVADNNSRDRTAEVARAAGAIVVPAPRQGYGSACLAAIAEARRLGPPDVVVFLDADHSDYPADLPLIAGPVARGEADMVIGSRMLGARERGALLAQAYFGNKLACFLMRLFWGGRYTDLGPFRAISWGALERLEMADPNFGWTVEMQVKALERGLRVAEAPARYRRRVGVSKITGTVSGTVRAGYKILYTIFRQRLRGWARKQK
jgi:glycosyltransferase involved in cell wall biosynthesis